MDDKDLAKELKFVYVVSLITSGISILNLVVIMFFSYVVFRSL